MRRAIETAAICTLAALGGVHLLAGGWWAATRSLSPEPFRIAALSVEAFVWFVGGGLVFLFAAFLNLVIRSDPTPPRWWTGVRHTANILACLFLVLLALVDPRPIGNAGVYLSLLSTLVVTASAFAGRGASR